jgi:hypothetical protein
METKHHQHLSEKNAYSGEQELHGETEVRSDISKKGTLQMGGRHYPKGKNLSYQEQ